MSLSGGLSAWLIWERLFTLPTCIGQFLSGASYLQPSIAYTLFFPADRIWIEGFLGNSTEWVSVWTSSYFHILIRQRSLQEANYVASSQIQSARQDHPTRSFFKNGDLECRGLV